VNLGSRLEGLTKTYGVTLLVSEATRAAAGPQFVTREIDRVAVKGKREPIRIFELLGRADSEEPGRRQWIDEFDRALALYHGQRWEEAAAAFTSVLERRPDDSPSRLYVERCRTYAAAPPRKDWDGVTVMETK
jgi:adenylate cyclase